MGTSQTVKTLGAIQLDSPIGQLFVAATDVGILKVGFESEDLDVWLRNAVERLNYTLGPELPVLHAARTQLGEYFSGQREHFDVPLDFSLSKGFRQEVQKHLLRIGYGMTETYKQVAVSAGSPNAVRAVGSACATNPLPVLIPCHRVLRSDGGLGGYAGGLEAKQMLLKLEVH